MNLIQQPLDMIAVTQRSIERKADLRRKAQTNPFADLAPHKSKRAVEPVQRITRLLFIAHDADVDLRLAQILCACDGRHCHETDPRVFQFMENNVADFLFHKLLELFNANLCQGTPPL